MQRLDEFAGIGFHLLAVRHRKAKLRAAAARNSGEDPVPGMAVKGVPLRPDDEGIKGGGVAQLEVRPPDFRRRLLERVAEFGMRLLPGGDAVETNDSPHHDPIARSAILRPAARPSHAE
ncbi:MAG: hypothetical protein ABIO86_18090 [Sphingomonas sp.]